MSGGDFFDSNVFVYLFDQTSPGKTRIAEALLHQTIEAGTAVTSFQVVQETLNVLTRKLVPRVSANDASSFMNNVLVPLWQVMPSQELYEQTLELQARYAYSFYDSLIIAAALSADCGRIYTEDLQHGQRIQDLVIHNPFS